MSSKLGKKNKFNKVEKIFLVSGSTLLLIIVMALFFSFRFISIELIKTFSPDIDIQSPLNFDIETYNKLGL